MNWEEEACAWKGEEETDLADAEGRLHPHIARMVSVPREPEPVYRAPHTAQPAGCATAAALGIFLAMWIVLGVGCAAHGESHRASTVAAETCSMPISADD